MVLMLSQLPNLCWSPDEHKHQTSNLKLVDVGRLTNKNIKHQTSNLLMLVA
jgi:hypothetical protein